MNTNYALRGNKRELNLSYISAIFAERSPCQADKILVRASVSGHIDMGKADFNIEVPGNPRTASGQLAAIVDDLVDLICK